MNTRLEGPALAAEVLEGDRRELKILAAEGLLPLPLEDLVELQVMLAESEDEEVARLARNTLADMEPRSLAALVSESTTQRTLSYLGLQLPHPVVLEPILRLRSVSHEILKQLAPRLDQEMQELLLLRQDAIMETPSLLEALDENPELSSYSRRRIREFREHLLPSEKPAPTSAAEIERLADELTDEEVEEAIEVVAAEPSQGAVEDLTGLTEAQIRSLPTPVRLKLSRGAPRTLRGILVRDPNPQVATSVVQRNPLTEAEVEEIASNRGVRSEVLQAVAANRSWMRRYPIVFALVRNPRSPAGIAVRLVSRLTVRDLQVVARDHNVPHTIRAAAGRLYTMKRH